MRVLVTGAAGFLGKKIIDRLKDYFEIIATSRKPEQHKRIMDITDKNMVERIFSEIAPEIVIHCAAMADVDFCEDNHKIAQVINVEGTKNIAEASSRQGSKMIYISTDFVFDGKKGNYKEDDKT
ncbi:MAG: sugar nucleotide-binding protein, partial [Nanoarchaeota archaeon]|nr:sugar nucleotide-binding protein [Nanoarchaeota archaeon]